jgi:hypothetical protein
MSLYSGNSSSWLEARGLLATFVEAGRRDKRLIIVLQHREPWKEGEGLKHDSEIGIGSRLGYTLRL